MPGAKVWEKECVSLRGPFFQSEEKGHHVLDLLCAENGLSHVSRADPNEPFGRVIARHDAAGNDETAVHHSHSQVTFSEPRADTGKGRPEIAVKAGIRGRDHMADRAVAAIAC